jgi:hypothetical protein
MRSSPLLLIPVVALAVASCGGEATLSPETTVALSPLPPSDSLATTGETTPATTTTTATPVVTASTTSTAATTSTTLLAGGPIDLGPRSGDALAVVGVAYNDTLNLRVAPGPSQDVVGTIDPVFENLVAQGETWAAPGALWVKVGHAGTPGWVHMGFVAFMGQTEDATSQVVSELGEYPVTDTMADLGSLVAETFASQEPPSRIVMTVEPTGNDLGEVTYDVIGLGDDAVYGVRLHVFGERTTDGFSLESVELTELCARDLTQDGLCV